MKKDLIHQIFNQIKQPFIRFIQTSLKFGSWIIADDKIRFLKKTSYHNFVRFQTLWFKTRFLIWNLVPGDVLLC